MIHFCRSRIRSFRFAFAGWHYVLRTQKNAWIHAIVSLIVLLLALKFRLPIHDWAILVIAIAIVWTAEFLNTAIEAVVDLVSPQNHPLAKIGKDVGAASVLLAAIASIIVGLIILGPPFLAEIRKIIR